MGELSHSELFAQINRAMRDEDLSGPLRRRTLTNMLDNLHSNETRMRVLCVSRLHVFFPNFPEFKERCIDGVYDICEDTESDVRKAGYKAIGDCSRADHSLVQRNADVLVQLLQNDEESELAYIKSTLRSHFDLDAFATLQVMVDSCSNTSSGATVGEIAEREQFCTLVVTFLVKEAKSAILALVRQNESLADSVVQALLKIIEHANHHQAQLIIYDLLTSMSIFSRRSTYANALLLTLIGRVKVARERDTKSTATSGDLRETLQFLGLCGEVAVHCNITDLLPLYHIYCPQLINRQTFMRLTLHARRSILSLLLDLIRRGRESETAINSDHRITQFTKQLTDAIHYLIQAPRAPPINWKDIDTLLELMLDRKQESGWKVAEQVQPILQELQMAANSDLSNTPNQTSIIRALKLLLPKDAKMREPQISTQPVSFRNAFLAGSGPNTNGNKRKRSNSLTSALPVNDSTLPSRSIATNIINSTDPRSSRELSFQKKIKVDSSQSSRVPVLLSRIQGYNGDHSSDLFDGTGTSAVERGIQIKGAAASTNRAPGGPGVSLHERLGEISELGQVKSSRQGGFKRRLLT